MSRARVSGVIVSLRGLRQAAPRPPAGDALPGGDRKATGRPLLGWPSCGLPPSGLVLGAAALGCAGLALAPGSAGPLAARALLAALAVGCAWWLVRRRADPVPPPPVRIAARMPLGRSGELAIVEVDGRRLLIGAGERPLSLLAELPPRPGRSP